MGRFDGKAALITGAASGMGQAIAVRLAAEGASVYAVDIDADGLAETASQASGDTQAADGTEASGDTQAADDTQASDAAGRIATQRCDLSSVAECAAAVAGCIDAFGRIDVLGNIAGISWQERVADVTESDWDRMFAVNVKGVFFLTQAALPHLLESGGNIVNIASNAGLVGMAYLAPYCATKGAVVQMTRALAMELAKTPVRVNAIAPGGVDTPMTQNYKMVEEPDWHLIRLAIGFRPMSQPSQVAALFAFVASDDCPGIHGAILSVDGGLTAG